MRRIYAGVFLISVSALTLEITLTRIISVKLYYHFSYLIISMALLGYGAAGAHLAVSKRFREESGELPFSGYAALFSFTALVSPLIAGRIPFQAFPLVLTHPTQLLPLILYYILLFLPFYFSGMVIAMALKQYRQELNRLYFFDLAGAGLGCMLVVFAIGSLGGPGTLALVSALSAIASLILLSGTSRKLKVIRWGLLCGALLLMGIFVVFSPDVIKTSKGEMFVPLSARSQEASLKYDFTRWGALTRVDVTEEITNPPLIAMVGPKQHWKLYKIRVILQDLQALTPMYRSSGDLTELPFLPHQAQAAAYLGKSKPEVLVIGPGGGSGVMVALRLGAKKVTAVEINPLTYRVITRDFSDYIGGLYHRPDVDLINAEGRSYLARSKSEFDVIEITLVDTFAALSSGAYSLSESYLYTVEAFEEIIDNLTTDGVLACSRNIFFPPRESLRLMAVAIEALSRKGIKDPWRRLYVFSVRDPSARITTGITLLKKNGFSPAEAAKVDSFCRDEGFRIIYNPYSSEINEFSVYAKSDEAGRREFQRGHRYDISPTTDDAPFFFQYFKWSQLGDTRLWDFGKWKGNVEHRFPLGHLILLVSLLQAIIFSLLFIVWPLRRLRRQTSTPSDGHPWGVLIYFAALGTAYMAIEIVLMQKLMVFLGYPLRSLTVVLFSLLISSGIGSAVSRRWKEKPVKVIGIAITAILILIPLELLITEILFQRLMGWPVTARFLVTALALFPLGFVMGIPFPMGLGIIGNKRPALIPWYWGINACFSVISSLVTVIISMEVGYRIAMIIAGAIYLVGYLGLRNGAREL